MSAVDQLKNLTQKAPAQAGHKDKLAATKKQEKEVHDALKQVQREKKEQKEREEADKRALLKEERMTHDTKRAHADERHLRKREEHKETGQMCEHGVWRCRICFPHESK
ncbi:hypothetical protein C2E21_8955 [Chlorella sorokiniana]|jgi:hypothetical protein|uniref:Uncharacterized protein n=1 Tax=Chlorella sorokiniana TaxID=3076 RepID=A0A2P6TCX4_CHLSO|nr:hypothetical protein C2E21_8955 [Chlorella sorokiniana]|eukprot:PRW20489.1 hypothetical protein C2E21_8955 [Chlorella sorokiniana]